MNEPTVNWVRFEGRDMSRATHWWLVQGEPRRRLYCAHNILLSKECVECADGR